MEVIIHGISKLSARYLAHNGAEQHGTKEEENMSCLTYLGLTVTSSSRRENYRDAL